MVCVVKVDAGRSGNITNLVIFGGDPVVGRTLELLMSDTEYGAKHLDENALNQPGALDEVEVALLGPNWNTRESEVLRQAIERFLPETRIPVLVVGSSTDGAQMDADLYVPWPCRAEDLKRRIEAARQAGIKQVDQHERRRRDQDLHRGG